MVSSSTPSWAVTGSPSGCVIFCTTSCSITLMSIMMMQALLSLLRQAEAADVDHNIVARDQESKAGIFTVNIPTYAESTEEQRRNRVMPDITWEALLCGAVHQVKTKGVLRASL